MKVQFWGLSKTRINKMINKVELEFQRELDGIEYKLERVQKENRNLRIKLDSYSQKNLVLSEDEIFWNQAHERLEKVIGYLSQQTESEMSLLRKKYAEKNCEITHETKKVNLEREAIEYSFSQMQNQIAAIVEQSKEVVWDPELINHHNVEENNMPIKEREATELVSCDIELPRNQADFNETLAGFNNTSDVVHEDAIADKVQNELTVTLEKNSTSINVKDDNHQDDFWGNQEDWTETSYELTYDQLDTQNMFTSIDTEFSENIVEKTVIPSPDKLEMEQAVNNINEISKPVEEDLVEKETMNEDLIEQIDAIKSQYIVGKMTGEDLLDADGKLIISQDTLITREVVEKANRAGKLAELIVNMKLSRLGED